MAPRRGRLERITNLVLALLETSRPLSLREIGSVVAGYPDQAVALRQAFERDKRMLRDAGIEVEVIRIDGEDQVGYRIDKDEYYLPDLDLTDEERDALGFALATVRLEGGGTSELAHKLGAKGHLEIPPVAVLPSLRALGPLQEAVRARATVRFTYKGRTREVEGYGLVFARGSWYFVGRDRTSPDSNLRTFRVDRFESAVEIGHQSSYDLPADFDPRKELGFANFVGTSFDESFSTTDVVLDVDAREARPLVSLLRDATVERNESDGSVRLSFSVRDEDGFISFVLGLGDAAEVIAPAELRQKVIARLEAWLHREEAVSR